ncbi:hypothetical protein HER10_EVM0005407 [Colletotrichum scovillei]|uniref:uncharacterized protein n=1 Tax=Colletotrichum scovillei TaxID=1209932 RepID=UPI0015C37103|nr:uncharacterized protein HER10_EVM0005407 [Colletotrichum scovillei]KAF4784202.1 hypothetical protein HER10_EVM0005407 [Colletotrichum scovillei]
MDDIENAVKRPDHGQGFAQASWLLASDVDSEGFIFQKFNKLSARNILYLQCEVLALEEKLEKFDRLVDGSTDTSLQESTRKWEKLDEPSRDGLHRIRRYNEKSITVAVGLISIALAAALLIGAIVGFSYVSRWSAKVGMICAFTIAFALCVGLTTNAKRGEIFAGTAAYAAVLVVFVSSGDLSGNQCCQPQ